MTNDELERAIDFILKSQARAETRIERMDERQARTDEQIASTIVQLRQLAERLDSFADTQANIMRVLTQNLETQAGINESLRAADVMQARFSASLGESLRASEESLRASDESLRAAIAELAARQSRTEEALGRLAETQANSDRRLEALIGVVEEGRRGGR